LFLEGVRDLTPLIDEPLADPAWVPTFLLSRFARTHVKTVLVGEGADELFAGYPTYLGGGLAARYARLPAGVPRAVAAAAPPPRPRQHGRLARGPRAVPRPPPGRVRLSPADRAQGARPRNETGAAQGGRRPGAAAHPRAREARAHRAARGVARRPAPPLRARDARPPRSPGHPARGGARAARRARGAPPRQPPRAVGAHRPGALARGCRRRVSGVGWRGVLAALGAAIGLAGCDGRFPSGSTYVSGVTTTAATVVWTGADGERASCRAPGG